MLGPNGSGAGAGQAADDPTTRTFDRGRGKRPQEQGRLAHVYDAREGFQRPWVDIRVAVYQSGEQLLQDLKGFCQPCRLAPIDS